uniref:Reverse transcriptase domain-containing protein n=1 Tax=Canis lupus familiaris TaxID=9615 RepID=A0A8C0YXG8_CANLF
MGTKQYSWTTRRTVDLGTGQVSHSFMVIPECPYPLLGQDLLTKIGAQICFHLEGVKVLNKKGHPIQVFVLSLEDEYRLHQMPSAPMTDIDSWLQEFPQAWTETGGIGLAQHRLAIYIELKPGADPVRVRQYPMPLVARKGITPHILRLLDSSILRPCQSAWNTPLLPVPKPHSNDYRPVQDLREVNRRVEDMHPTVPNPYTLLSTLPPDKTWYTVLDLKDAFFSLPLVPKSQDLFAFEWTDPEKGINGQLTWTQLPQGFKNSLTIFNEALHEDLGEFRSEHPHLTLLKHVDDILLAAEDQDTCLRGTRDLLQTIVALGYGASAKKAQICRTEVSYLGYKLQDGQRWLTETILRIPQLRDPWVAQRFGACLWPRAQSWRPGIESHVRLPVHGACFSLCLCVCPSLSLSLCDYHNK